ncbi:MAG TPA: hypothetical protein DCM08_09940 [Microscillaceae bacterium]|nr:hypothetical protein [Microscillaceae bacterium]
MEKLVAWVLIFNLLNTILLFPEYRARHGSVFSWYAITQEKQENQVTTHIDEINSLFEFVEHAWAETPDHTPENEDDEFEDFFKRNKKLTSFWLPNQVVLFHILFPPATQAIASFAHNPFFAQVIPLPEYYQFIATIYSLY